MLDQIITTQFQSELKQLALKVRLNKGNRSTVEASHLLSQENIIEDVQNIAKYELICFWFYLNKNNST